MATKHLRAARAITDAIVEQLEKVRAEFDRPTAEQILPAIEGCLNQRTNQWRKTAPPRGRANGSARLLWDLARWHRKHRAAMDEVRHLARWGISADPRGIMRDHPRHDHRADQIDRWETVAMVMVESVDQISARWRKALEAA